ncbi:1,2-dihydroxy-3-keto-5-methylthiopentene dioxygenase [Sphingosinicella soli]|uniref:Acireductone dioxygenase n=1 Tax=Sphingosinicella soli TaxID=333708 RepID=A0A7W7F5T0_9SPHN|nr:cupin [Sphingosinicella soli]MBB4630979.1 1,2-dihydroxy-3-keto-5-methylthiopentene dioxygenase [Sphingosinicella soli]
MSHLAVYAEGAPERAFLETADAETIAQTLGEIGVLFERWPTRDVPEGDILAAYAEEIERLKARGGYQAVDVASMVPDHPERAAFRQKFLSEHRHMEDEVRFFVDGEGLFTLHEDGRVFNMLCTKGDLIAVPARMRHWFDMGPAPRFTAIRLFINPEGWVAHFTGDDIADRFPRHEPALA